MESQPRILVIDDQPLVREFVEAALLAEGYLVKTAGGGREAIDYFTQDPSFGLVITDLMMPEVSGLDVLAEAKAHLPNAEVIIITAHGSLETAVEALRRGAHDYIIKPFEIDQLVHSVQRTLIFRRLKLEKTNLLADLKQQGAQLKRILTASNQLAHLGTLLTAPFDKIIAIIQDTLDLTIALTVFDAKGQIRQTEIPSGFHPQWGHILANLPPDINDLRNLLAGTSRISRSYLIEIKPEAQADLPLWLQNPALAPLPDMPMLAIPLEAQDGPTIGVIWITEFHHALSLDVIQHLEILANQVTGTLENINLSIAQQQQVHVRNTLVEADRRITTALDRQAVLNTILEATIKIMPQVDMAFICYHTEGNAIFNFSGLDHQGQSVRLLPFNQAMVAQVENSRQTTYLPAWVDKTGLKKSLIIEPLTLAGVSLGVLAVISRASAAFTEDYRQVLTMLTSQAAIALQNARLYAEARRVDELGALVEAGQSINRTLNLQETLTTTLTVTRNLTGALVSNIYLYTPQRNRIDSVITLGEDISLSDADRRWAADIAWEVLDNNRPILLPESEKFPGYSLSENSTISTIAPTAEHTIKTWLAVPLATGEMPVGALVLGSEQPDSFTPDDPRLMQVIASQAATAIENSRLYEEVERRLQQTEALGAITQSISTTLNLRRVLELIVQSAVKTIPAATHSIFYMLDKDDKTLHPETQASVYSGPLPPEIETIRLQVIHESINKLKPVRLTWRSDFTEYGPWALLVAPLQMGDSVIGAISVESPHTNAFLDSDEILLSTFASHASVAIQNANLFRDLSTAYVDLTHQQNETLRSNRTLQALFDGITDGLYIVDQDLKAIAVNRAEAERLGTSVQALIGQTCNGSVWGQAAEAMAKIVLDTFDTGAEIYWENTFQTYGQTEVSDRGPFANRDVRTYPIFKENEQVSQVIIFAQDVSEKRRLQASLFRSANLASIGQLASSVAHEINNPLTVVIANSQIMQMDATPEDPNLPLIEYILDAGMRIQRIVQNLLDFSTQERYEWSRTDIESTIDDALTLIAAPLRKGKIEVIKHIEDLPLIKASSSHLKLLWMNLLLNARDAITANDRPGVVEIIATQPDANTIQIQITDNGPGIPPQYLSNLFLPFFTTKPPGKSPGLGLYTCRTIVERHQGQIDICNRPQGLGAVATVTLPVKMSEPEHN